jgi:hypothetical protein
MNVRAAFLLAALLAGDAWSGGSGPGAAVHFNEGRWELFDDDTPVSIEALSLYDSRELGGNDDGEISAADAIWPRLRIWQDLDGDGVPARGEMRPLPGFGLRALATIARGSGRATTVEVLRETVAGRGPRANPR